MTVKSDLYSLKNIVNQADFTWLFNIPIYQRLYVWRAEQIDTLLSDIVTAFEHNKEESFFLGNTVVVESNHQQVTTSDVKYFDLIDGQQRFTTLWLLSSITKESSDLNRFSVVFINGEAKPRLHFSIRDTVNDYLQKLIVHPSSTHHQAAEIDSLSYAQERMRSFISKYKNPNDLSHFIYTKVMLVLTEVSPAMDLNQLFEIINNRGVQLQHHEILKAKLLSSLAVDEQQYYGAIWDACSDMDNFIDHSLRSVVSNLEATEIATLYENRELGDFKKMVVLLKEKANTTGSGRIKLEDILAVSEHTSSAAENDENKDIKNNEEPWSSSIISFSMFLQHVLRIWLFNKKQSDVDKILDKQLLAIFNKKFFAFENREQVKGDNVRSFIGLLWQIRVLWDDFVIKRISMDDEKIHRICSRTVNNHYLNTARGTDSHRGLALLQSMLYHSQEITTHYWLTPFLQFLVANQLTVNSKDGQDSAFNYLRHLDNNLLGEDTKLKLVERSRLFMENPQRQAENFVFETELTNDSGVNTPHYWFYKLDFVLWYKSMTKTLTPWLLEQKAEVFKDTDWANFRFTAKNSVEHISPQHPQGVDLSPLSKGVLDTFGNLVLVSRSLNSEYGNLPFNEKQPRYNNKKNNAKRPESLKMDVIYQHKIWGDEQAKLHQEVMLKALAMYYENEDVEPTIVDENKG